MSNPDTDLYVARSPGEYLITGFQELVQANIEESTAIQSLKDPSILLDAYVALEGASQKYADDDETQARIIDLYNARERRSELQQRISHIILSTFLNGLVKINNISQRPNTIQELKYNHFYGGFQQKRFPSSIEARIGGVIISRHEPILQLYRGRRGRESPHTIFHVRPVGPDAERLVELNFLDL